ncbi:hypothetical protein PBOI14_32900 [Pseudomonas sp. Boi14]|nr:hypothetical protein PBOI14_32900 [Pseudomonas sp. Boi14]
MTGLPRVGWKPLSFLCLMVLCSSAVLAANQPYSGRKGGIARCDGELFLCNDGSISASKKNCALMSGQRSTTPRAEPCCATPRDAAVAAAVSAPGPGAGCTA